MIAKTRERTLKLARDTLTIEATALQTMRDRLEGADADALVLAVDLLHGCKGRIVVSGIGKSGHIARKIAATFASTGSPAFLPFFRRRRCATHAIFRSSLTSITANRRLPTD
jgi:arabinose-5-phosphate isomerase